MKFLMIALMLSACTTKPTVQQKARCSLACLAGTATLVEESCLSWWRGLGCKCFSGETIWIEKDK